MLVLYSEALFSAGTSVLGSVFSDCVVFYVDVSFIVCSTIMVQTLLCSDRSWHSGDMAFYGRPME